MKQYKLVIEELNKQNFHPFGEVIDCQDARQIPINQGSCTRFHDLAKIDVTQKEGHVLVNIFRATAVADIIEIKEMEKHPLGSQAFIPLAERPFLIVVAEKELEPRAENLRCFITKGQQGINYAPNVWHHPLLALFQESDFLVIDRGGEGENCVLQQLPANLDVRIDINSLKETN